MDSNIAKKMKESRDSISVENLDYMLENKSLDQMLMVQNNQDTHINFESNKKLA